MQDRRSQYAQRRRHHVNAQTADQRIKLWHHFAIDVDGNGPFRFDADVVDTNDFGVIRLKRQPKLRLQKQKCQLPGWDWRYSANIKQPIVDPGVGCEANATGHGCGVVDCHEQHRLDLLWPVVDANLNFGGELVAQQRIDDSRDMRKAAGKLRNGALVLLVGPTRQANAYAQTRVTGQFIQVYFPNIHWLRESALLSRTECREKIVACAP